MSKKKKSFNLSDYTDLQLTQMIEKKWGEEITHLAPIEEDNPEVRRFNCLENDTEAILTVDKEGWVLIKVNTSAFGDVLGTIF